MFSFELKEKFSPLSSGLRPTVNVVDMFPRHNRQIQVQIWLKDKGAHNRLYSCFSIRLICSE